MERKEVDKIVRSAVDECNAKLDIINDYLDRFKISDNRLVAPIHDIERCIETMHHILHYHGGDKHHV